MKTISSLISESQSKQDLWEDISNDIQALKDRGKTKTEALILANYFEGKVDGLVEALMVVRKTRMGFK